MKHFVKEFNICFIAAIVLIFVATQNGASFPQDDALIYDTYDIDTAEQSNNSSSSTEVTTAGGPTTPPTPPPPPPPPPRSSFDVGSFFGGLVLGMGLLVLGYLAYIFYRRHTGRNYQRM